MLKPIAAARRHPWPAAAILGAVLLLGGSLAWALPPGSGVHAPEGRPAPTPDAAVDPSSAWKVPLHDALDRGLAAADAEGGTTQAGIWVDTWATPIVLGNDLGAGRLWSLSKPVTAIAALEIANAQGGPTPVMTSAMRDAITRSDNCAQRQVVLELQRLAGIDGARTSFDGVLQRAGVTLSTKAQSAGIASEPDCRPYVARNHLEVPDPGGTVLQFGTGTWTLHDAVQFAHGLAGGTYGRAGETVLELMRQPKERVSGSSPTDYTAALDEPPSGGTFPKEWGPAYKGGWGGHSLSPPNFRAAQIVVLDVGSHRVALVAIFRPGVQPPSDDPGATRAPQALKALSASVEHTLSDLERAPPRP
ncbi:MAG: hypothetical protein QOJ23_2518 [Actinomycetota bacterium]|nr:hypothetical protein [Actinomycetota bacterium]